MSDDATKFGDAVRSFLAEHPDVRNSGLVLHGILVAHPELRDHRELDLDSFGKFIQYCEEPLAPPV